MIQANLKKQEKSRINNLTLHIKELEKGEQTKPKVSRREEIIKIRVEISEWRIKKILGKTKMKGWFFENINKISKHLAGLTKEDKDSSK